MPTRKPSEELLGRIGKLVAGLRDLKHILADTERDIHNDSGEGVEDQLIPLMKRAKMKTASTEVDGVVITGTLVEASEEVVDGERLKKAVGAEIWKKITTPKLDKAKLIDAMATGLVDKQVVAQCSSEKPKKPYVKITERKK